MEKINIDLNSLFNLSYNFENLKLLLTTISKNQDLFENRMKDLEKKLNENTKNIQLITLNNDFEPKKENQETNNENNLEEIQNSKLNHESNFVDLDKKVLLLENKVKLLYNFIPLFPEDKTKTLNDILDEYQNNINNNCLDIKEMKDKISKIRNEIEQINIKVNDFKVYDIFKDISSTGGDIEASKLLFKTLEKKMEERFLFQEEKLKNDEEEALKLKNEIINLKNNSSFEKKSLISMKEKIINLQNEIDINKNNITEKLTKDIEKIKEKEKKNLEDINNKFIDIIKQIKELSNLVNIIKEETEKETKNKNIEEDNSSTIQKFDESNFVNIDKFNELKGSILKKINNLEKKYQDYSEIKNEQFEKEINSIKIELENKKPSQQEFYNLSAQVSQFSEVFDTMKEENTILQNDLKKTRDNISALIKRYENVVFQTMNLNKGNEQSDDCKISGKNILQKFDDYVEISIFNEFIREQTKFSEKLKKDFDSYRHFYDEIIETLKKAASVQDLKNLEEYFVDLLDEFKDKSNKFFSKKSEVNKNFKALELQIKQLYEYIIKKDEHGENWMLAKKPLGGYSCASCEAYLGELKENNEKILWNQLPEREVANININRMGNGFSRILNLVNINKEINNENLFNSSMIKPDYGAYKNELIQNKLNGIGEEKESVGIDINKQNITMTNFHDNKKNTIKEPNLNNNITSTNSTSLIKNSFPQEEKKFILTSSENMNIFKEMKSKKFNKALPPINANKEDNNLKDINLSAGDYFEEIKEFKGKKEAPKVMKIIRKKNK